MRLNVKKTETTGVSDDKSPITVKVGSRMSKIKNSGLDQYGTKPFKQQQFGTAGIEGVNGVNAHDTDSLSITVFSL